MVAKKATSTTSAASKQHFLLGYLIHPLFKWLNIGLFLLTCLAYLSPYISPAKYWIFSLAGLFYPWLLFANLLFVAFWFLAQKRYYYISIVCILLGLGQFNSLVGFHFSGQLEQDSPSLQVMSFNCHGFRDVNNDNKRLDFRTLNILVKEAPLNFLCLQEFLFIREMSPHIAELKKQTGLAYQFYDADHGLILLSAYPIQNGGGKYFGNRANGFQFIDVKVQGQMIRLYNIHLQSNRVTGMADKVANEGDLKKKETWQVIKTMLRKYKYAAEQRVKQAEEIANHIAKSPYPVVLAGDLNDVPQSYVYKILSKSLNDGFKKNGSGLGFTYSGDIPGLRIDYILASPELTFKGYQTSAVQFSDHLPIVANIQLKP